MVEKPPRRGISLLLAPASRAGCGCGSTSPRQQRRAEVRKGLCIPIEVVHPDWGSPALMVSSDLSPTGVCLRGAAASTPGDPVVVTFRLPDRPDEFSFFGEVVRAVTSPGAPTSAPGGFAVRFLDVGPRDRLLLREALRRFPPPLPSGDCPFATTST
jgi:hypothetical protein